MADRPAEAGRLAVADRPAVADTLAVADTPVVADRPADKLAGLAEQLVAKLSAHMPSFQGNLQIISITYGKRKIW